MGEWKMGGVVLWAVSIGEDGNIGVHGDVIGDRSERLGCGWNFIWDECGISDKKDGESGEVWADGISRWNIIRSFDISG